VGDMRNAYKILVSKLEGQILPGRLDVDNSKMDIITVEGGGELDSSHSG
jgi:hypothetical protein